MHRFWLLIAAVVLTNCGGGHAITTDWTAPERYEFELESTCGERNFLGRYRIVVEDSEVTEATGLDASSRRLMSHEEFRAEVPTLAELLEQARDAQSQGADIVDVAFDASDGHPTQVNIDWDEAAMDDEACYDVEEYTSG